MSKCKSCKQFRPTIPKGFGECKSDKFVYADWNQFEKRWYFCYSVDKKGPGNDCLTYCDAEAYFASFKVGENFGCIHFE